jgi:hypothetical protein
MLWPPSLREVLTGSENLFYKKTILDSPGDIGYRINLIY